MAALLAQDIYPPKAVNGELDQGFDLGAVSHVGTPVQGLVACVNDRTRRCLPSLVVDVGQHHTCALFG